MPARSLQCFRATMLISGVVFAGSAGAHVDLLSPNGGESLNAGDSFDITWQIAFEHNTENWDLWYSVDGPSGPWIEIAVDLPAGDTSEGAVHMYAWAVPADAVGAAWVRVRQDNAGDDYTDESDASFEIVAVCPWDLDADSDIGVLDLLELLGAWGQDGVPADFDGGGVGTTDLLALLANWGSCQ